MVSPVHYSPSNGGRYSRPFPPVPYLGYSERHSHSSPHDARAMQVTMTDQQLESDGAPQRKRIAVACGRCRKRKIRCSGDPGTGQPCSNCKNAGVDECLFLRVQSREAPMRVDPDSFYSVGDARMYASRAAVNPNMPYAQDLPNVSAPDVAPSYRGNTYPYPASKQYYPAYGPPYTDEFDYSIGVPSQPVLSHDPVGLLPGSHWAPRAKQPTDSGYGNMMMTTEPSPYPYSGHSLVHRPAVSSDASNFSFSGVAASLPSTSSTERLLPNPNPMGRSATATLPVPFPGQGGATSKTPASVTTPASTSTLADVAAAAAAASYAGGAYDTSGLPYPSISSSSASTGTLGGHHQHASVSRTPSSDSYSGGGESIFSEQERSLGTQGTDFDMNNFTAGAGPRRGSSSSGGHSSSTLSNGQTYVPSDGGSYDMHHPSVPSHHHATSTVAGYAVAESPTAAATSHGQEYRRSQSHQGHQGHHHHGHHTLGGGNTSSSDNHRQQAVSSRR